jgi:hypothetical protein
MGRLTKIMEKDGVVWALDMDTHQIKKLTIEVVSKSQLPEDVIDVIVDDLIEHKDLSASKDCLE